MSKIEKLETAVRNLYESKNPDRADWADWLYENHVFVVADIAEKLAKRYAAPIDQCRAAGMLHDIADATISRFNPGHEETSLKIARDLLENAGFDSKEIATIVDDAIRLHSCFDGHKPKSLVGNVLSTADALAHLNTNFYVYATENLMANATENKRKNWAAKKIPRDFNDKIAFDEVREETRANYKKLAARFGV